MCLAGLSNADALPVVDLLAESHDRGMPVMLESEVHSCIMKGVELTIYHQSACLSAVARAASRDHC